MYTLVLTKAERDAISWVGYRYGHGDNLKKVLLEAIFDEEWDEDKVIIVPLYEDEAWEIRDIGFEDDFRWTCFCPEFADKMNEFCEKLI